MGQPNMLYMAKLYKEAVPDPCLLPDPMYEVILSSNRLLFCLRSKAGMRLGLDWFLLKPWH